MRQVDFTQVFPDGGGAWCGPSAPSWFGWEGENDGRDGDAGRQRRDDNEVSETTMTSRSCCGRGGDDRPGDWECNGCGVDVVGFKIESWDVGVLDDGISGSDEICADKYNYFNLEPKGKARDEKCHVCPWSDKTTQVERDSAGVLPRSVSPPSVGGSGFGSSPNLTIDHTMQELCLPSERGMGAGIGRGESRLVSADRGEKLTDEEVDEAKREMDVGGGGQIDAGEFVVTTVVRRAGRCGKRTATEDDVQSPGWSERTNCIKHVTIEHVERPDELLDPSKSHTVVTHATVAAAREQEIQLSTQRVQHQHSKQVMQEKTGKKERER